MLTIWGRLNSHNVKKVAWLAQEIGLPHRRVDMGGAFGFSEAYLAMNPNRLIPTITVEGGTDDASNVLAARGSTPSGFCVEGPLR